MPVKERGEFEKLIGHRSGAHNTPVNHLLFADDSLLFTKANMAGATEIRGVLDVYCQASGQRVNLAKSSIHFSKGCPNSIREAMKITLEVPT